MLAPLTRAVRKGHRPGQTGSAQCPNHPSVAAGKTEPLPQANPGTPSPPDPSSEGMRDSAARTLWPLWESVFQKVLCPGQSRGPHGVDPSPPLGGTGHPASAPVPARLAHAAQDGSTADTAVAQGPASPWRRRTALRRVLAPRWTLCRRGTSARSPAASVRPEPLPAERPPQAPPPPAHLPRQAQHLEEGVVATPCPQPGVSSSVPVPDPAGLSMDTGEALTPVTPNTCQPAVHSPGPRCGFSPTCPSRSPASLRGPGELAPWEAQLPPPVRPRAQRVPRGPHLRPPGRCGL